MVDEDKRTISQNISAASLMTSALAAIALLPLTLLLFLTIILVGCIKTMSDAVHERLTKQRLHPKDRLAEDVFIKKIRALNDGPLPSADESGTEHRVTYPANQPDPKDVRSHLEWLYKNSKDK